MLQVTWLRTLYLSSCEDYYGTVRRHFISSNFFIVRILAQSACYLCCSCPCIGLASTGRIFVLFVKVVKIRRQTRNLVAIGRKYGALCPEDVSRLTRIEKAVKNTTIFVMYKVLVYIQMSQPAKCFGLFYLGYHQVGNLSQRKCTIVQYNYWSQVGMRSRLQKWGVCTN